MFRRSLNRRFHIFKQAGFVVDDLHGSPTQYIRRPHHDGITDLQGDAKSLVFCIAWLFWEGIGIWGLNVPVGWAFDITKFVFWIGIGHAGTLISAILFLF